MGMRATTQATPPPVPFAAALVLGADSSIRGVDRYSLRTAGVSHSTGIASGAEALRLLTGPGHIYDLVLCDEHLSDMSGQDFLAHFNRLDMEGRIPVILSARAPTEKTVLQAIAAGCAGFLARPFTVLALEAQLCRARTIFECGPASMLSQTYAVLADSKNAEEEHAAEQQYHENAAEAEAAATTAFHEAAGHLRQRRWDKAIEAFGISMRSSRLEADACLGMARAWLGKGKPEKAREYSYRAGTLFMRARNWSRAREAFVQALAVSPANSPNPLLDEALELIRNNRIDDAAQALIGAYQLPNTETVNIHSIARAAQFVGRPEQTIERLCTAVHHAGGYDVCDRLRRRLLTPREEPQMEYARRTGLFANFPLLHDAVTVARYTAKCWRMMD